MYLSDTISLIHRKRKVYHAMKHLGSPSIIAKYKHLSNLVHFRTRADTSERWLLFLPSNCKQMWRWINSVKGYRHPLPPLQGDYLIVDDEAKATAFNQYFQSVFTDERLSDLGSLQSSLVTQSSIIDSISFTPDYVHQDLLQLEVSKACGPNLIPLLLLLKRAAAYICVRLSQLFNQSMSSGKLPHNWVTANISIFKKGD